MKSATLASCVFASIVAAGCVSKDEVVPWTGGAVKVEIELPQSKFDTSREVDVVVWGVAAGASSEERLIPHALLAEPVAFGLDDAKLGDEFRAQVLGFGGGGCSQIVGQASGTITGERVRVATWTFSEHDLCQLL